MWGMWDGYCEYFRDENFIRFHVISSIVSIQNLKSEYELSD